MDRKMIGKWYSGIVAMLFSGVLLTQAQDSAPPPPAGNEATDVVVEEAGDARADEQLVNLTVSDARIQDVLRSLGALRRDTNIIIDPNVSGPVSLQLENVPWEAAFEAIMQTQGLDYRVTATEDDARIYRVYKPEEKVEEAIMIDLYTEGEVQELSDAEVMNIAGEEGMTVDAARQKMLDNPDRYIERLSVDQQSALDVVRELAKKAELNYTFSPRGAQPQATPEDGETEQPDLEAPEISLNLRNLTVEHALVLISNQGGLSATEEDKVWVISQLSPKQREVEPLKLETYQINFIPLDNDLVAIMESLTSERGTVSRGKSKILIVKDTQEGLDAVRQTLDVMDKPTPQVLIEARFFQITNNDTMKLGVDWQDLGSEGGASFGANTEDLVFDYGDSQRVIDPASGAVDPGALGFDPTNARTAILSLPDFSVVLHALKGSNQAEELANPKIVVSSDEQATIHIGEQRPIIATDIETTDSGGAIVSYKLDDNYGGEVVEELMLAPDATPGSSGRSYKTNTGYLDLGTKLTVLPSVKTEEEVYIRVVPELMSVIGEEQFPLQGGQGEVINTISFPQLFRTYVRTQFTVKSGQTIAIGGLVSKQKTTDENKVPLLGSIPYLGRAFRYNEDVVNQSETIIFLTVKIIAGKELNVTSAVPIRSRGVQDEVDRIHEEDARGAVYDEEYVKQLIEELEDAEKDTAAERLKRKLRRDKTEDEKATGESAAEDAEWEAAPSDPEDIQEEGGFEIMDDTEAGEEPLEVDLTEDEQGDSASEE